MATRGWGKARKFAAGGAAQDPAYPTPAPIPKLKEQNPKPAFTSQRINKPFTHHTATSAVNLPKTQRKPWLKLD